jgi:hypothetical protein
MLRDRISTKLARPESGPPGHTKTGWGAAMRQRTFHASVVAFMLGLLISIAWSFLHAYGL